MTRSHESELPVSISEAAVSALLAVLLVAGCGSGGAQSDNSPTYSPPFTIRSDQQACDELSIFVAAYQKSSASWAAKSGVALSRVNSYERAGKLPPWRRAWKDLAADFSGAASDLTAIPGPASLSYYKHAVLSSLDDLSSLASRISRASFAYWNANNYLWANALNAHDDAVSGMASMIDFQKRSSLCF